MKKIYFLFLLALLPLAAYADAVEIDGIYYNLNAGNKTAEVTSNPNKYSGVVSIPATVTYGNVEYNVTSIGSSAFYGCYNLISVTIPNSVTSIGSSAFSGCDLISITIPNSVTSIGSSAFYNCSHLTSITIPNSVTSIGDYAFGSCRSLTSITIPNSVTTIGNYAFSSCSLLTSITIPSSVTSIGTGVFANCSGLTSLSVESGNTKYDSRGDCNAIIETETNTLIRGTKNIVIPNSVTSIGDHALSGYDLTSITIPNSVTSIGDCAFMNCYGLTLQVERTTPLDIDESVFDNISNSILRVPAGCKAAYAAAKGWSLFSNIFEGNEGSTLTAQTVEGWDMVFTVLDETAKTCQVGYINGAWDKLAVDKEAVEGSVTIPEVAEGYTVVKIGKYAFNNTVKMTSVTIPETVTSIEEYAFWNCNGLTSFELPTNVTYLGEGALVSFRSVTSLKVAEGNTVYDSRGDCNAIIETATNKLLFGSKITTIPADVPEIGENAFHNLVDYTLTIPSTVTKIDDNAFRMCGDLTLEVEHTTPLDIDESVFYNIGNSILRVPAGSKAAYAAATGWNRFNNIYEGNEGSVITAKTVEGWDMVFTVLDETAKTCQVGYINGNWDKLAVDKEAVEGSLTIPEIVNGYTVVKIGRSAFDNVSGMTSVTIPSTVTAIDENAFNYCNGLTSFELPATVISLGDGALRGLSNVTSFKVAAGNQNYDSRGDCNAIIEKATNKLLFGCRNTIIPASVTEIGRHAFSLENYTLTIPSTITKIDEDAFSGNNQILQVEHTTPLNINGYVFQNLSNSTLRVPAGCKAAYAAATGWNRFDNIYEGNEGSTLTAKTAEGWDMVFTILDETAKTCQVGYIYGGWGSKPAVDRESVEGSVTIPETVEGYTVVKIGQFAFYDIHRMTSVTIPNTVTAIDEYAFSGYNLTLQVERTTPLDIDENVFGNVHNSTLRVPTGSKAAYAAATGWSRFDYIFEENEGSTFTAKTTEGWDMVFTILDKSAKTCQVGYLDGSYDKLAVDKETVEGSVTIPEVVEGYTVVKIGRSAFDNINRMASVTIPETVTTIGEMAFLNCNGLTSFELPAAVISLGDYALTGLGNATSFKVAEGNPNFDSRGDCNAIIETATNKLLFGCKNTIIPASVPEIGNSAFHLSNCTFTIPSTITKIGDDAFSWCYNVTLEVEHTTPLAINENVFEGINNSTLRVPEGSKSAYAAATGWSLFSNILEGNEGSAFTAKTTEGWDMTFAVLDETKKTCQVGYLDGSWDKTAVNKNTVNGAVTIPNTANGYTVVKIGKMALNNIDGMTSVTIPESVITIDDYAFFSCDGLKSFELPASVTSLGTGALSALWNVTSFKVAEGNTKYDSRGNCNAIIEKASNKIVAGCQTTTIPASVVGIGNMAFDLYRLSIFIPSTVTFIENGAFRCDNLTLEVEHTTPLAINENVFQGISNSTLRVPAGCKAAYAAATGWKNFGTILEGNEGSAFTAKTTESWDMVFTILDETKKTCQVGYLDGSWNRIAVDRETVNGPVTIPETVEGYTVVKIGKWALTGINGMTSVTIPNRMNSIGDNAFYGCDNLTSVIVESETPLGISENVFPNRANVTLYVPTGSKAAYEAADYWKEFKEIIETGAQSGNIAFASSEVKAACVAKWDTNKDGELSYAEAAAVTRLVDATDYDDPFAQLALAESEFTFDEFQYFTGVTSLYQEDFGGLLTSITLPNSITSIGQGAFWGCKLTSIHIPASVTDIYMSSGLTLSAFSSEYLQTITVDAENTKYSSPAGSNAIIERASNTLILGCGNTDFSKIPSTVTEIGPWAFASANFTNPAITLPSSVKVINNYAFDNSNIKSINWGDLTGLTTIGTQAFYNCQGLTEVTLPTSFESMGDVVFGDCNNIVKVVSNIEEPFEIPNNDFKFCTENAVLYVPQGKVDAYISAGWEEIISDNLKSFRRIVDGNSTAPEAIEGLVYNGTDQKLILPGTYRTGMMEYSLDGSTYSTSVPTGKEAGEYTVYYRKVGLSDASILKVIIAAPKTISVFSGSNLWAGYVATENLAIPTGLKAYVITSLDATTATASPLDYIPQGVPVLLKRENTSDNNFEMSAGSGTAPTVNLLKTYESAKNVSNREGFILYNDEFVLVNEGTLPAGRVFLPANKSGVALTRGIVTEGDDTTGIYNSKMDFDDSDKQWYDLQGRKLERKPTKKGIYILDGRKVVIK